MAATHRGAARGLRERDLRISPRKSEFVALVRPQSGQGLPVMSRNGQTVGARSTGAITAKSPYAIVSPVSLRGKERGKSESTTLLPPIAVPAVRSGKQLCVGDDIDGENDESDVPEDEASRRQP